MKKLRNNRKGQLSLEAGFILLIITAIIPFIWFSGPVQSSTEKMIDVNGVALGYDTLSTIDSAVTEAGMSGEGSRVDFTVHIPSDTVYMKYGNNSALGPHINMTVLMYSNAHMPNSGDEFSEYSVDDKGDPYWVGSGKTDTPFYYANVTIQLDHELEDLPLCTVKKNSTDLRGAGTRLKDVTGKPIRLCCESGFNLRLYAERLSLETDKVLVSGRLYYKIADPWNLV